MESLTDYPAAKSYINRVMKGLAILPQTDRDTIRAELISQINELVQRHHASGLDNDASLQAAVAEFGPPADTIRRYIRPWYKAQAEKRKALGRDKHFGSAWSWVRMLPFGFLIAMPASSFHLAGVDTLLLVCAGYGVILGVWDGFDKVKEPAITDMFPDADPEYVIDREKTFPPTDNPNWQTLPYNSGIVQAARRNFSIWFSTRLVNWSRNVSREMRAPSTPIDPAACARWPVAAVVISVLPVSPTVVEWMWKLMLIFFFASITKRLVRYYKTAPLRA